MSAKVGAWLLKVLGWKVVGEIPATPKIIFAVAPHTSNWDFIVAIAAMLQLNLKVKFMAKASIFVWPLKPLLLSWGGIAVDRSAAHGVVGQMVEQFKQNPQMILGIAPEGTRKQAGEWKTGFLHIAHQAKVPVGPVTLHFDSKEIRFHPAMEIGADITSELARVKAKYQGACAKNKQVVSKT
ncbi:1-acyl-sn-glycerol-3-phosphate acyltransferase [Colwellia sp. MEBiC06753]